MRLERPRPLQQAVRVRVATQGTATIVGPDQLADKVAQPLEAL